PLEERKQRDHHQRHERIGDLPVADDDARGQRDNEHYANHPRGWVFPEFAARIGQREPLSRWALGRGGHWGSSRLSITVSSAVVAGSSRSCAAFLALSGSPAWMASSSPR